MPVAPSVIADAPCCGLTHRVLFSTDDLTGAPAGDRFHYLEIWPRFVNGFISIAKDLIDPVNDSYWAPAAKATKVLTISGNTLTFTGVIDELNLTIILAVTAGTAPLSLTSVVGSVIRINLATTSSVISTTMTALATFMNAQPSVAALVNTVAAGATAGSTLLTAQTINVLAGNTAVTSTGYVTHGDDSLKVVSDIAGHAITVVFNGGTSQTLAVTSVVGDIITIQLGTTSGGVSTSSMSAVSTLINGHVGASAISTASVIGPTTTTTLVQPTDDFVTKFPLLPAGSGKQMLVTPTDEVPNDTSIMLTLDFVMSTTAGDTSPSSAIFAPVFPDPDILYIDDQGRINVVEMVKAVKLEYPLATKVLLKFTDQNTPTGSQVNSLGWEWEPA